FAGRALALGAGAINSARIALRSVAPIGTKVPLLCNPYSYVVCLNLAMLGRPAADRRHSMSQLTGVLAEPGQAEPDRTVTSFYSHRSLMLSRLVGEVPVPPFLGLQLARVMQTALTIVGIHQVDGHGPDKWLQLQRKGDGRDVLAGNYEQSVLERARSRRTLR